MIEIENLTKYYGSKIAVDDISFTVNKGEILGFLGPNGAGKSTTMKIITGYLSPTAGTARINGFDIVEQSLDARRQIGYLPEHPPLYLDMTVRDYLKFAAAIHGVSRAHLSGAVDTAVERCGLRKYYRTQCNSLSKGFRQRVGIAQAMVHEPAVLILDEPTIGLDPIQIVEIRELINTYGGDHTVILSTHILPEVDLTCERVIIINDGRLVAEDTTTHLRERVNDKRDYVLEVGGDTNGVQAMLSSLGSVISVTERHVQPGVTSYLLETEGGVEVTPRIARMIVESGLELRELRSQAMTLEEIFINVTMN